MTLLSIAQIRIDGGTQPRASIDDNLVAEYRADMMTGAHFPPVTVFFDGSAYWLADGFHRIKAASQLGQSDIEADIRQGNRRDAVLHSVSANSAHGLRRTNEDKRRAVMTLLNDAEWQKWSDNEIAKRTGVSQPFVSEIRKATSYNGYKIAERNGTAYTINTANIGSNGHKPSYPSDREIEKMIEADSNSVSAEVWSKMPQSYVGECYKDCYAPRVLNKGDELEYGSRGVYVCSGCNYAYPPGTNPEPYTEEKQSIDPDTGEISTTADHDVPFDGFDEPETGQTSTMPPKVYHAGNRTVGDQFHSKLMWNYRMLFDDVDQATEQGVWPMLEVDTFTIGYSQRNLAQFLEILKVAKVSTLIDVRRDAYSKFRPEFNKQALGTACKQSEVKYIHVPELGVDHELRNELGETHDYDQFFESYKARLSPQQIEDILRKCGVSFSAYGSNSRIAFMCVEIDPQTCHRSCIAHAIGELYGLNTFDL